MDRQRFRRVGGGGKTRSITGFETYLDCRHSEHSEESITPTSKSKISVLPHGEDMKVICHSELVSESKSMTNLPPHPSPLPQGARERTKVAFTLAEVLITLGIIGVVAAMTIPSLITNYQKHVTVESLKKMYSTLLQAARSYQADNEETIEDFDTSLSSQEFMDKYFKPYLKVSRSCTSYTDCWNGGKRPTLIDGINTLPSIYGYVLLNGTIIVAHTTGIGGKVLYFDVNGPSGLNRSGRDIFEFIIFNVDKLNASGSSCESVIRATMVKSGIYPGTFAACYKPSYKYNREQLLGTGVDRSCNKNAPNQNGWGDACAAVIMLDGWKISKDYPW